MSDKIKKRVKKKFYFRTKSLKVNSLVVRKLGDKTPPVGFFGTNFYKKNYL